MAPLDPVALINEAISARNWPLLVVAILLVVTPVILHLVGKNVPIVSTVLNGLADFLRRPAAVVPPEEAPKGVNAIVVVEQEKK